MGRSVPHQRISGLISANGGSNRAQGRAAVCWQQMRADRLVVSPLHLQLRGFAVTSNRLGSIGHREGPALGLDALGYRVTLGRPCSARPNSTKRWCMRA